MTELQLLSDPSAESVERSCMRERKYCTSEAGFRLPSVRFRFHTADGPFYGVSSPPPPPRFFLNEAWILILTSGPRRRRSGIGSTSQRVSRWKISTPTSPAISVARLAAPHDAELSFRALVQNIDHVSGFQAGRPHIERVAPRPLMFCADLRAE